MTNKTNFRMYKLNTIMVNFIWSLFLQSSYVLRLCSKRIHSAVSSCSCHSWICAHFSISFFYHFAQYLSLTVWSVLFWLNHINILSCEIGKYLRFGPIQFPIRRKQCQFNWNSIMLISIKRKKVTSNCNTYRRASMRRHQQISIDSSIITRPKRMAVSAFAANYCFSLSFYCHTRAKIVCFQFWKIHCVVFHWTAVNLKCPKRIAVLFSKRISGHLMKMPSARSKQPASSTNSCIGITINNHPTMTNSSKRWCGSIWPKRYVKWKSMDFLQCVQLNILMVAIISIDSFLYPFCSCIRQSRPRIWKNIKKIERAKWIDHGAVTHSISFSL